MSHPNLTLSRGSRSMSQSLIKRRTLLKGLGAASFLAAPVFRATLAEAQAAPLRLVVLEFPGGASMVGNQGIFSYDQMLKSLAPFSSDILILENLVDPQTGGVDLGHGCVRVHLTGDGRGVSEDEFSFTPPTLTSFDQAIAATIGKNTRFSSLEFGVSSVSPPQDGFDRSNIIWSKGVSIPAVQDPATMFSRLFSGAPAPPAPTGSTPADADAVAKLQALNAQRQSILDLLKAQVTDIQGLVGSAEKRRLDEHLSALRELEKSIMSVSGGNGGGTGVVVTPGASCGAPSLGGGTDVPAVGAAMSELLYQAINCDATRVASLQWLTSGSTVVFTWIGGTRDHHAMQHAPGPDLVAAQNWLMSQIAVVIKRLKETPEGSGSMLDNCLVVVTSEMGDGETHINHPIPMLIAGKAGGQLRTGRSVDLKGANRANLGLNIGSLMGAPLSNWGDPAWVTGPLELG